ncbi:MAG: extracellular solute-binding protein [Proteobacteria bacterium]|nr:extracellular solute-binding protein [Pseudomonadota bacterium]
MSLFQKQKKLFLALKTGLLFVVFLPLAYAQAAEVNLYTDRQAVFLKPLLAAFEKEHDISVNVLFAKKGLLERMQAEGTQSPADVVMVVDIGRLQDFVAAKVLAPYRDSAIAEAVLPGYANDYWVAVTRRARVLYVGQDSQIENYDDLAVADNRGKVCLRSGLHIYNIGLIADRIARNGLMATRQWLVGLKQNLARKPQGKDRTQIKDVAAGVCGVGIANSYYYFQLLTQPGGEEELKDVRVVIPPQAHINVTGAALAAHAPHRENALALLRFLVSQRGQEIYAAENNEFPVRTDVRLPAHLAPYQQALSTAAPVQDVAQYRRAASKLVEEIGLDR